ncbi:hypothetical protein CAPTEDRAFT_203669, partial [Capitella teleta]
MADQSPSWKKPLRVLKVSKKKKKKSECDVEDINECAAQRQAMNGKSLGGIKRKNPFGCPGNKQPTPPLEESRENVDELFARLHSDTPEVQLSENVQISVPDLLSSIPNPPVTPQAGIAEPVDLETYSPTFPMDWSLKTKIRFLSDRPFQWCCPLKSSEEAKGLETFVKDEWVEGSIGEDTLKQDFHACCMLWTHPHLPWLNLFPRMVPDGKIGKSNCLSKDEAALSAIQSMWAESFTSLFQQLRAGSCPYFYVCTHQFTVLFRHVNDEICAVLTPSTRGFRQSMLSEGIDFTMPLNKKDKIGEKDHVESSPIEVPDEAKRGEDDETDESNSLWLQDLGLDKKQFKALNPERLQFTKENWREIDQHAESCVNVSTPQDTVALFNFLLNCRSCIANSGVQLGLPPTLLSPLPFKGAVLDSLQVRASAMMQDPSRPDVQRRYRLEVSGALLPSNCQRLMQVLRRVHQNASVSFTTVEESTALNCAPCSTGLHELSHVEHL